MKWRTTVKKLGDVRAGELVRPHEIQTVRGERPFIIGDRVVIRGEYPCPGWAWDEPVTVVEFGVEGE